MTAELASLAAPSAALSPRLEVCGLQHVGETTLLEACIENTSRSILFLNYVRFEPAPLLTSNPLPARPESVPEEQSVGELLRCERFAHAHACPPPWLQKMMVVRAYFNAATLSANCTSFGPTAA